MIRNAAGVRGRWWAWAVLALILAASASVAGEAFAHAEPVTVKPGDGAVLTTIPSSIEMLMSQDLARQDGANDIDVFDASGKEITAVAAVIDNGNRRRLTVAMPLALAVGAYTVKWKSLSADDGDTATGQFSFTFDPNAAAQPGKETQKEEPTGAAGTATATSNTPSAAGANGDGGGTSWVLVIAVAVGMFVVGGGTTFLLVQKRP